MAAESFRSACMVARRSDSSFTCVCMQSWGQLPHHGLSGPLQCVYSNAFEFGWVLQSVCILCGELL